MQATSRVHRILPDGRATLSEPGIKATDSSINVDHGNSVLTS
jgi:hypothetical protein